MSKVNNEEKWFSWGWLILWIILLGPLGFAYLAIAYNKKK